MANSDGRNSSTAATLDSAPPDWAELGASLVEPASPRSGGGFPVASLSKGERPSPGTMAGSALLGGFVGGNVWYWATVGDFVNTPWLALPLGAVIALTCRSTSGGSDAGLRAGICGVTYLLALGTVLTALTYRAQVAIYGEVESFGAFEQALTRSYLQGTEDLVAYGLGAAICWALSVTIR